MVLLSELRYLYEYNRYLQIHGTGNKSKLLIKKEGLDNNSTAVSVGKSSGD
jgi:hypothetical protein